MCQTEMKTLEDKTGAFNPNKSQVIIIGGSKQIAKLNNAIPSLLLTPFSSVVKNIGVLFDSTLSWSPHIVEVSRKMFVAAVALRWWKNLLPVRKSRVGLAQSPLLPILNYTEVCVIDCIDSNTYKIYALDSYTNSTSSIKCEHRR